MRTLEETTAMVTELVAWLDGRPWNDLEKGATAAASIAIFMTRFSTNKDALDRSLAFMYTQIQSDVNELWKMKCGEKDRCSKCGERTEGRPHFCPVPG